MFRYENSLPRLPLPLLSETTDRYLDSIRPFVDYESYESAKERVNEFVASDLGRDLQRRLIARANHSHPHNWMSKE